MNSENTTDHYEDNKDAVSRQSLRSTKKDSPSSPSVKKHNKTFSDEEEKREVDSRSKTRVYHSDPDRDQISGEEGRRSAGSYYSDDYESPSERSLSPYSRSHSPSPTRQRRGQTKRVSSSPLYKTGGVGRRVVSRPQRAVGQHGSQQLQKRVRSQSNELSAPKDLDLVTKRMLSARLVKINELRNALAELQQRTDELQKENRILRQLQVRQEKALQRYDDTESEISQLISRHSNDIHVLRERLRRTQERERAVERRLKESEEQLQRSQASVARLKKLVDQRDLGQRDELSRKLDEEKALRQEAERKIKELERSMELSNNSLQRQLVAEKKRTIGAQEEARTLQEELERLTNKLKEKERELDTKNIYANRMLKPSQRKDAESGTKQKLFSRNSTKAVQTEDLMSNLDFPTPPPAITYANGYSDTAADEYLSLKDLDRGDKHHETSSQKQTDKIQHQEKAQNGEKGPKQQLNHGTNVLEEKTKTLINRLAKEQKQDTTSYSDQKVEEKSPKPGHVQEEVQRWNQEVLTNQQVSEVARHKKEHLLAKMHEIDQQNQTSNDSIFDERNLTNNPSEQKSPGTSIFSFTQPDNSTLLYTSCEGKEGGRRKTDRENGEATTGLGRRAFRSQISTEDMAFGNYAPSFGHSTSRGISSFPPTPLKEDKGSALEAIGLFSLRKIDTEKEKDTESGGERDRKSSLMQQLFGNLATSDDVKSSKNMELLSCLPSINGVRSRREGFSFNSGSSTPPASSISTLHIAETRPAIRAITSFDDDIEELTL